MIADYYNTCLWVAAKALAAKHKKPMLPKRILIPQSDHEDSTQDSVSEGIANVRHTSLLPYTLSSNVVRIMTIQWQLNP